VELKDIDVTHFALWHSRLRLEKLKESERELGVGFSQLNDAESWDAINFCIKWN